jgi:hypothetical protein
MAFKFLLKPAKNFLPPEGGIPTSQDIRGFVTEGRWISWPFPNSPKTRLSGCFSPSLVFFSQSWPWPRPCSLSSVEVSHVRPPTQHHLQSQHPSTWLCYPPLSIDFLLITSFLERQICKEGALSLFPQHLVWAWFAPLVLSQSCCSKVWALRFGSLLWVPHSCFV